MSSKRTNESRKANAGANKRVRQQPEEDRSQGSATTINSPNIVIDRATVQRMLLKLSTIESKINATDLNLLDIKEKVSKIEDRLKNEPSDESIIMESVKTIAKELMEVAIYPTQAQFLSHTETYLSNNKPDFYKRISRKRWTSYYEKNIYPPLLNKHRSFRGTLTSRIKDAMFAAFGSDQLPLINTNASSSEIMKWKTSREVRDCYKKVLTPHNVYIKRILEKVFGNKRYNVQVAFTLALIENMLNPKREDIKIKEDLMQIKIEKYMDKLDNGNISDMEYSEDDDTDIETNKRMSNDEGMHVNEDDVHVDEDVYVGDDDEYIIPSDNKNLDCEYTEIERNMD